MAKTTINNGDTGLVARNAINDNFTELYTGAETVAATDKPTPVDADVLPVQDSAASNVKKRVTWANIKATLKTYFDTLYATIAAVNSAQSDATTGIADAATAQAAADAAQTDATTGIANAATAQSTADAALDTRTNSQASTASLALNVDTHDVGQLTAQAEALILANPTGTPVDNNGIIFKIKDDATPRAITFGSEFRAMGVALPTTTVASKWMYIVAVRNSTDTKWDVVSVNEEA